MYELIQAGENTYYIDCPVKMGLYRTGKTDVVLIDSGSDKDAGKKVLKHLKMQGWNLAAVYHTHAHADHIGGNRVLQERTGCNIYAPGAEAAFVNFPFLEGALLGGGFPYQELRGKFLLAEASKAEILTPDRLPEGLEALPLPGHSPEMTGYRTADSVVFLGDCVTSEAAMDKYGVPYNYDVRATLETLDAVEGMEASLFVPAHAEAVEDIRPLVQANRRRIEDIIRRIIELCERPRTVEDILRILFGAYMLHINFQQYALIGSAVRSYLACLRDKGLVIPSFRDNRQVWTRDEKAVSRETTV